MRKVTKEIKKAFLAGESKKVNETRTDGQSVYLHGHEIIKRDSSGLLLFNLCGYGTAVTRERIKHICDVDVYQKDHEQYYNGEIIIDWNAWHVVQR
jgi:hypothetical protein